MPGEQVCLFCGKKGDGPDHYLYCDGRQGHIEAAIEDSALYGYQGNVPYEAGSVTSQAAAASQTDEDISRQEASILALLKARPRTCDALEEVTGQLHQTMSARLRGMVLKGQIEDSGKKDLTRSHRWAVIWQIKQEAPSHAQTTADH